MTMVDNSSSNVKFDEGNRLMVKVLVMILILAKIYLLEYSEKEIL